MNSVDWSYLVFPAALVPAALLLARHNRGGRPVAREALPTCAALLRLLAQLQQHRGLSSGWLAGDRAFEARMMARRAEIDTVLGILQPLVVAEDAQPRPCLTSNDLSLFRHHWRSLCETLEEGNVEQNIGRHTRLIATVLDWLAAIGEARIELPAAGVLPPGLVRNYAHRLPALAECLGQARALGSSVAVQRRCPAVSRVRLMFLIARAETLLEQAALGDSGPVGLRAAGAVRSLVSTVRTEMLSAAGISLGADAYFVQATQAVDAVFAWAEDCACDIGRLLGAADGHAGSAAGGDARAAW